MNIKQKHRRQRIRQDVQWAWRDTSFINIRHFVRHNKEPMALEIGRYEGIRFIQSNGMIIDRQTFEK